MGMIGDDHYNPSSTKSTKIRDPLILYIHWVLSGSLCQRDSSGGVVNLLELTCLSCLLTHQPIDVAHILLRNMPANRHRGHPNNDLLWRMDRKVVQAFHSANSIVVQLGCRYYKG
ncbi:hypothetical protein Hanom_Chr16g01474191 [Helianthus anomalus]